MDTARLKNARLAKSLSQKRIAELLDIDKTTYSKWEAGTSNPIYARLEALAAILDVTPNYLMGADDKPTPEHAGIFELYLKLSPEEKAAVDTLIKTMANKNK